VSLHRGQIVKPPITTDFSGSLASMELYKIVQHYGAHDETSVSVHCPPQPRDLSLRSAFW